MKFQMDKIFLCSAFAAMGIIAANSVATTEVRVSRANVKCMRGIAKRITNHVSPLCGDGPKV
ncbi:hypothetical protein TRL7639_00133 [Falsiruegeria litorea R37]|uniref:Uncharacterized protein n=1 Tax=Falsiruegeria litorea R37 TaxID=1200284 RepID=A0A1Y5RBG7_9RHOB|nr:hypothetical protein TRL7639_00133 [Falsiruegeria litorea R37]